jgi:branched-chain amino acid transport system ATP-binding protein/neutral amino acid transport system ATP-binding protein
LVAGYGGSPVIHEISMTVGRGEVVTVLGPNGSGKSTFVKAVGGQIPTMAGRVTMGGKDVTGYPSEQLAAMGVGYVPQERDVFAPLTVHENLLMGGYLLPKRDVIARVDEIYQILPRLADLRASTAGNLSGGERKLLAIGRVLMLSPKVVLLDEPTANLSPMATVEVLVEHVRRLAQNNTAVLLVEQKAIRALEISDWTYILVNGSVRLSESAADIAKRGDISDLFLGSTVSTVPTPVADQ